MNNNKYDLKIEQLCWLDANYQNKSQVVIVEFTPNKMFATVHPKNNPWDKWQVMTNRLSPIEFINGNDASSHAGNYNEERS